jgi:FAD synthase
VIHGDGRGQTIGYPTANVALSEVTLPDETFSCRVKIGEEVFLGAGVFQKNKLHPTTETTS